MGCGVEDCGVYGVDGLNRKLIRRPVGGFPTLASSNKGIVSTIVEEQFAGSGSLLEVYTFTLSHQVQYQDVSHTRWLLQMAKSTQ